MWDNPEKALTDFNRHSLLKRIVQDTLTVYGGKPVLFQVVCLFLKPYCNDRIQ